MKGRLLNYSKYSLPSVDHDLLLPRKADDLRNHSGFIFTYLLIKSVKSGVFSDTQ